MLFKAELINPHGPWRTAEQVELATLEYVDWFNHGQLYEAWGDIPPAELEAAYYRQNVVLTEACRQRPEFPDSPGRFSTTCKPGRSTTTSATRSKPT